MRKRAASSPRHGIEITLRMVRAGLRELQYWRPEDASDSDDLLIRRILGAALKADGYEVEKYEDQKRASRIRLSRS